MTAETVARMRARADELTERVRRMTGSLDEAMTAAAGIEVTATSGDGLVIATVGVDGRLRSLRLDPLIYHQPDAAELSRSILETVETAATEAQRRAIEAYSPLLPARTLASLTERDPRKIMESLAGDLSDLGSVGHER